MMTRFYLLVVALIFAATSVTVAQQQQMFILTAYGGLFFPANVDFKDTYKSSSDLMYGFGVSLPIESSLFLIGEYGVFHSDALINTPNDSSLALDEHFWHAGLMLKQPVSRSVFFCLSGGLNLVSVKQTSSSASVPEQSIEAAKKVGYFGGAGFEYLPPNEHVSFFGDMVYDYRRVHEQELLGDFGGVRIVVGIHLYMY